MAVVHELARGEHGGDELGAVDHRVEAAFQQADQHLAGVAAHPHRVGIDAAELLLGQVAVMALQLLLGAKLDAEVGHLAAAALAVLAGAVFAAVDRTFRTAPDVLAHAAVDLVLGGSALGHLASLLSHQMVQAASFPLVGPIRPSGRQDPACAGHGRQWLPPPKRTAAMAGGYTDARRVVNTGRLTTERRVEVADFRRLPAAR